MSLIDVEELLSILWAEGFEYEILEDEESGIGALRVYGDEARATIGDLYWGPDGWYLDPDTMLVTYRSGDPFWGSMECYEEDIEGVGDAFVLFSFISNALLAQEAL